MKIFKKVMWFINSGVNAFLFGLAIHNLFIGDYKEAAWMLFVVSIFLMIGYFAEQSDK